MTDNGQCIVLRYKGVKYKFCTAAEIMIVTTHLQK